MRTKRPARIKMGYVLKINRTGEKGAAKWEQVGFLFGSSGEATQYREHNYPTITKWSVQAVRLGTAPVVDQQGRAVA